MFICDHNTQLRSENDDLHRRVCRNTTRLHRPFKSVIELLMLTTYKNVFTVLAFSDVQNLIQKNYSTVVVTHSICSSDITRRIYFHYKGSHVWQQNTEKLSKAKLMPFM
jgi:hypothetical protein